jgi:hypothetical protein
MSIHHPKRFRIFIVDSGFNEVASRLVQSSIERFRKFARAADVYVLNERQSTAYLRKFPLLIGKDPVVVVVDREARSAKSPDGFGIHFQLGVVRREERARWYLKILLRALNDPEARENLPATMREALRLEGLRGLYWTVMETFSESLGHH